MMKSVSSFSFVAVFIFSVLVSSVSVSADILTGVDILDHNGAKLGELSSGGKVNCGAYGFDISLQVHLNVTDGSTTTEEVQVFLGADTSNPITIVSPFILGPYEGGMRYDWDEYLKTAGSRKEIKLVVASTGETAVYDFTVTHPPGFNNGMPEMAELALVQANVPQQDAYKATVVHNGALDVDFAYDTQGQEFALTVVASMQGPIPPDSIDIFLGESGAFMTAKNIGSTNNFAAHQYFKTSGAKVVSVEAVIASEVVFSETYRFNVTEYSQI